MYKKNVVSLPTISNIPILLTTKNKNIMRRITLNLFVLTLALLGFSLSAAADTVFDFNASNQAVSTNDSQAGDITEAYVQTIDGVTLTVSPADEGESTPNRFWGTTAGPQLRCYSGTITIESENSIKSVVFDATSKFSVTANVGELSSTTWSGDAKKIIFTVNKNTQINKITVSAEVSSMAEAANIAAFKALEKGTEAKLTLNNAYVTAISGNNAYVQDATGALYFYNTGLAFEAGKVLNGTIIGKLDIHNNLPEFTKTSGTNADGITITDGTTSAITVSVAQALAAENISMLVKIAGATIEEDGGNYYAVDGESKIQIYDQFKVLAEGFQYPAKADITGIIGMYKGTPQLYPLDANSIAEAALVKDQTINHNREVGQGYGVSIGEVDFTEAKSWLGVEELTTAMLNFENPDGSLIDYATYAKANYDGWCNGEGAAENWGGTTKVCVKFFQAIPDGKFEICDMNGADEVGKTYTVKWQLVNGNKAVRSTINVTFVAPQATELEVVDKGIVASVSYDIADGSYIEKTVTLTDEQVAAICAELGIGALSEATVYGYNPTSQELVKNFAGYDGWRDANGDFHGWSGNAEVPACVKYTDGQNYLCYNIQGCEPQTIKTYWAIANDKKAVLVEIDFIYLDATADPNNLVKNWNCSGSDVSSFRVHEWRTMDAQTDGPANLVDGAAKVYVRSFAQAEAAGNATLVDGSKPVAADNFADWDSQFFITWDEAKATEAGDKLQLKMKVKADKAVTIGSQVHKAPGAYVHWYGVGDINVTTEWADFVSAEVDVVSGDPGWGKTAEGCWTIAFNLAKGEENTLYFDDMVVYVIKPTGITEMYRINPESGVRYNLSGKRVDDSYKGIVILNGKKMLQK